MTCVLLAPSDRRPSGAGRAGKRPRESALQTGDKSEKVRNAAAAALNLINAVKPKKSRGDGNPLRKSGE